MRLARARPLHLLLLSLVAAGCGEDVVDTRDAGRDAAHAVDAAVSADAQGQLDAATVPDSSADAALPDDAAAAPDGASGVDAVALPDASADGALPDDAGTPDSAASEDAVALPDAGQDAWAPDPCASVACPADQHCEPQGDAGDCVNNTCGELGCSGTTVCEGTSGGGAVCRDLACASDDACRPLEYCDGTLCQPDLCWPGSLSCQDQTVLECLPNGSGTALRSTCSGAASFASLCEELFPASAACSCQGDWDCLPGTRCEGGLCLGSGQPPACTRPVGSLSDSLPSPELVWGGTQANHTLPSSAFPSSNQVMMTPLVANLDDDNGDGRIDEQDIPEIVFMTYCGASYTTDGVLRAIHGGGPHAGEDFFAVCGGVTWHASDALPLDCPCASAELYPAAGLAMGDLDHDGRPEIVAPVEGGTGLQIFSSTGDLLATLTTPSLGTYPHPALADLDGQGLVEIVVGNRVVGLALDGNGALVAGDTWTGALTNARIDCVADLDGDGRPDIVSGSTAYRFPRAPAGVLGRAACTGSETDPDAIAWCGGTLPVLWDAAALPDGIPSNAGLCAVADLLGADPAAAPGPANPLDGTPEVALVAGGRVYILDAVSGARRHDLVSGESGGGAPVVDDLDGDGFPEIGAAFSSGFVVFDLQDPSADCPAWPSKPASDAAAQTTVNPPRSAPALACSGDAECADASAGTVCNTLAHRCVCLHNGWRRLTEDNSSQLTGSAAFDLDGDGAAEVVYNDECRLRIYGGADGIVVTAQENESGTILEYPAIADVDNDGQAELIFSSNNYSSACSEDPANTNPAHRNGVQVWGDARGLWGPTRRIWNQHAYHVTNVLEGGGIPPHEPDPWKEWNGRRHNTYRAGAAPDRAAPDLAVAALQFVPPSARCGALGGPIFFTVELRNQGDARVGRSVTLSFEGAWTLAGQTEPLHADASATPLQVVLEGGIPPGASRFVSVAYNPAFNSPGTPPDRIRVTADAPGLVRECDESNNSLQVDVAGERPLADLRLELGAPTTSPDCPGVPTTLANDGAASASDIRVRYYAGDPLQGGRALHDERVAGPLAPGAQLTFTPILPDFPTERAVRVWAVADPGHAIADCNDANNAAAAPDLVTCDAGP